MKILHVIPYFVPAWAYGGPVKVVYEITRRLVKRNCDVTVFTTDVLDKKRRATKKEENIEGIKVERFSTISNSLSWRYNGFVSPGIFFELVRRVKGFDLIHLHEYYTFQAIVTPLVAQRYKIPYIISTHGSILAEKERGRPLIKKIFNYLFSKMIFLKASYIFVLNKKEQDILLKLGVKKKKICILPNAIDPQEYKNLPVRGRIRSSLGISEKEKIILFVGRIYQTKGLDLLIRALVYLDKNLLKKTHLLIVGPSVGNYKNQLLDLAKRLGISDKIIFTGGVYGEKRLSFFKDSNLYIQPSYSDGFPISVLEALACNLPVVVTKGTNLFFLSKRKAVLMVRNDSKEIALGIEKVLKQKDVAEELIRGAKPVLKNFLTWDKILDKITLKYNLFKE